MCILSQVSVYAELSAALSRSVQEPPLLPIKITSAVPLSEMS